MQSLHTPDLCSLPPQDSPFVSYEHSQLLRDQLDGLFLTEGAYVVPHVPCLGFSATSSGEEPFLLEEWRRKICHWAYRVIDHFQLDREVASIAMNIFDRFVVEYKAPPNEDQPASQCPCPSCKRGVDSRSYQLAAMTTLYMSMKLNSTYNCSHEDQDAFQSGRLRLSAFVELSRGQFKPQDLSEMEQLILSTIKWRVTVPTPMAFVSYFMVILPGCTQLPADSRDGFDLVIHVLRELSRYVTELSVCLGECSHYPPSHVAFAAILVSMDLLTHDALPEAVRHIFSRRVIQACPHYHADSVTYLRTVLQRVLWPEMLLDNKSDASDPHLQTGHPIKLARQYGLLDMNHIYADRTYQEYFPVSDSPTCSPKATELRLTTCWNGSPISVTR